MIPPKPPSRPDRVSLLEYGRLFRRDILSAQPARLYRAWMAEFRTPFFHSFMVNDPALLNVVLKERPDDFPKSDRIREGLVPLLGRSVFVTNGEEWKRQRRIIDPAFGRGRLRDAFPAMMDAAEACIARLPEGEVEIEREASHVAADVIFRTLFSVPIEDRLASAVFDEFRAYQRTQPLVNLAALLPLPRWVPRPHAKATRRAARSIRTAIAALVERRAQQIEAGNAPDDLATKIMTYADPETGHSFSREEMVDQVAIFFLAGHETSASALAWGLYLLAADHAAQTRVAVEAPGWENFAFSDLSRLSFTRDVFRETLRLYPPVPMMVREATRKEVLRDRKAGKGAQIVLSPWHLHRHERLWDQPDAFDPDRWSRAETKESERAAYMPFSAGPRVCTGAGFAMAEGVLLLSRIVGAFEIEAVGPPPVPVAHLTVRSRNGIRLRLRCR
ncbi:cytochrome P450 [Jannaschia aquimarina]|uniref:Epi-isozizaene 5-monooxygenase/(E)-beta-farnesene synthase n=1 Tax=Jannaschia aquimarina TaxID=935700 RepID=A0A0D1EK31_9RHOB|nr:cytochrome P450 [Jannaschia aquimarina]KIT17361.1 Epi-isozizaene 5-monooxygenase/(E)-beta-farnesene synthase [Jannaschia aquimarina]SNT20921.1 Cytochrome P450 [Jannaschia aquimarina]